MISLDCTLRDGGYYNNWDFEPRLVQDYLNAMDSLQIDFVEIGFRTLKNDSFKGGFAYSTDTFLNNLNIPSGLNDKIGVMINGSEIVNVKTQTNTHDIKSQLNLFLD
jgi:4-hydroxy 2-oxovalerate aldolase